MPTYVYQCPAGHITERIRHIENRHDPLACHCSEATMLIMSRPHVAPDGVYSYAPNLGDPDRFERQREAMKNGQKTIPRELSKGDLERIHDPVRRKVY